MTDSPASIKRLMERHELPHPDDHVNSLPLLIRLVERAEFPFDYQKQYVLIFLKGCLNGSIPKARAWQTKKHKRGLEMPPLDHYVTDESSEYFGKPCGVLQHFSTSRTLEIVFKDRTKARVRCSSVQRVS
jgi:hypothetical protein